MSPATEMTLPVHMRVGDGEEFEVGSITVDLIAETAQPDMPGVQTQLAAMLRTAADAVETQESGADS